MVKLFYILILSFLAGTLFYFFSNKPESPIASAASNACRIENIMVENGNGNVRIKFQLSDSTLIDYVKAEYMASSGISSSVRASSYMNELVIEGIDSTCNNIKLYSVDKAGGISKPFLVKVNPKPANYKLVFDGLKVTPVFGGFQVRSINKHYGKITVISLIDTLGTSQFVKRHSYQTEDSIVEFQVRNLKHEKIKAAFFVQDQFDNKSDTLIMDIFPLIEEQIDRSLFSTLNFLEDAKCLYDTNISMIWDGNKNPYKWPSFYTMENTNTQQFISFSIGKEFKLSRIVIYPRRENGFYDKGNLKDFEVWGTNKPIQDKTWDNWEKLATFHVIKPSGLLNDQFTKRDDEAGEKGWSFNLPPNERKYKYLRIKNLSNWRGSYFMQLAQVEVWGI